MQDAVGIRALKQDAYRRGGEARQAHVQARRVLQEAELRRITRRRPGAFKDGRACRAAALAEESTKEAACPFSKHLTSKCRVWAGVTFRLRQAIIEQ